LRGSQPQIAHIPSRFGAVQAKKIHEKSHRRIEDQNGDDISSLPYFKAMEKEYRGQQDQQGKQKFIKSQIMPCASRLFEGQEKIAEGAGMIKNDRASQPSENPSQNQSLKNAFRV